MNPHPRGSLFDDYVGPEEGDANGEDGETQREGSVAGSESAGTPPQRVVRFLFFNIYENASAVRWRISAKLIFASCV